MREVYFSDVAAAARVLLLVPVSRRNDVCTQMLKEADWADKFTRRLKKPHPQWGNGTLMATARLRKMAPENSFSNPEYSSCFVEILQGLEQHRATKTCKLRLHAHMKNELHHGFAFG